MINKKVNTRIAVRCKFMIATSLKNIKPGSNFIFNECNGI